MRIRPIGELVDAYRFRHATLPHDKLFALFGMADSQKLEQAALVLDYGMPWGSRGRPSPKYCFGDQVIHRDDAALEV